MKELTVKEAEKEISELLKKQRTAPYNRDERSATVKRVNELTLHIIKLQKAEQLKYLSYAAQ